MGGPGLKQHLPTKLLELSLGRACSTVRMLFQMLSLFSNHQGIQVHTFLRSKEGIQNKFRVLLLAAFQNSSRNPGVVELAVLIRR